MILAIWEGVRLLTSAPLTAKSWSPGLMAPWISAAEATRGSVRRKLATATTCNEKREQQQQE